MTSSIMWSAGHEFVGEVVALGEGAAAHYPGLDVGDLAVAEQLLVCHKCWFCTTNQHNKVGRTHTAPGRATY